MSGTEQVPRQPVLRSSLPIADEVGERRHAVHHRADHAHDDRDEHEPIVRSDARRIEVPEDLERSRRRQSLGRARREPAQVWAAAIRTSRTLIADDDDDGEDHGQQPHHGGGNELFRLQWSACARWLVGSARVIVWDDWCAWTLRRLERRDVVAARGCRQRLARRAVCRWFVIKDASWLRHRSNHVFDTSPNSVRAWKVDPARALSERSRRTLENFNVRPGPRNR